MIRKSDYDEINFGDNPERINYELLFKEKLKVLKLAYENFKQKQCEDFKNFEKEEDMWLDDYATFMALKNKFDLKSFQTWDDDIKLRKNDVLKNYKEELKDEIKYWKFVQYEFFKQWTNLKNYVNELGIKIIGDIPIYVAEDSADLWSNPKVF